MTAPPLIPSVPRSYDFDNETAFRTALDRWAQTLSNAGAGPKPSQSGIPVFNVSDYLGVGNGTSDDTVAVRATITAAGVAGGIAYFPKGTWLIDPATTISILTNTTIWMAPNATFKLKAAAQIAADSYLFTATTGADNVTLINFTLDGNRANQTKRIRGLVGFKAKNMKVYQAHATSTGGSAFVISNCPDFQITHSIIELCGRKWSGASGTQGEQGLSVLCDVASTDASYATGCVISMNTVRYCGWDGINLSAPGFVCGWNTVYRNGLDFLTVGAAGIYWTGGATAAPGNQTVIGNHVYGNTGNGIDTGPNAVLLKHARIIGNTCHDNIESGIQSDGSQYVIVEDNLSYNNNAASTLDEAGGTVTISTHTGQRGGICLASNDPLSLSDAQVRHNICYGNKWGVQVGTGSTNQAINLVVEDNDLVGNTSGAIGSEYGSQPAAFVTSGFGSFSRNRGYTPVITAAGVVPFTADLVTITLGAPGNVTGISTGRYGDTVALLFTNANATLIHAGTFYLRGAANQVTANNNLVVFRFDGTNWREMSRNF